MESAGPLFSVYPRVYRRTYVERLVCDPVNHVCTSPDKDLAHRSDKVGGTAGLVGHIRVDLGLDVEEDGIGGCALDKVEHLVQGGELCPRVDLCKVSGRSRARWIQ